MFAYPQKRERIKINFNGITFKKIKDDDICDYYYISTTGDILSTFWNTPRVLKPRQDKDGYLDIGLVRKNGKRSPKRVHRLVAQTYLPNPHNYPVVNHINGVKTDNRPENLEWCTVSHNTKHGYDALGVIASRQKVVYAKNTITQEEWVFKSMDDTAKYFGVDSSMISRRISGAYSNPTMTGKLKGIYFKSLGYANVTTIENFTEVE